MSDLYKNIYFGFTEQGTVVKAKQNNGYKYSFCSAIPFIDINDFIKNRYTENTLSTVTANDILNNVIFMVPKVLYTMKHGIPTADKPINSLPAGLPIRTTYSDDKSSCTYSVRFNSTSFSVINLEEDLHFDGIIFLGKEYKSVENADTHNENDTFTYIPCAIAYLPEDGKIDILHDQNPLVYFNFEVKVNLVNDETDCLMFTAENTSTLHLVDDGQNTNKTTLRDGFGILASKDKLFMADLGPAETESYDTYSKLNIMNTLDNKTYPQLSFQYADNDTGRTWDGRRVEFLYTSASENNGNPRSVFTIREIKGYKQTYNSDFNLFAKNNGADLGSYENGYIYSNDNRSSAGLANNFINSDHNIIDTGIHNSFTNADYNILSGNLGRPATFTTDNSFINSNHNQIASMIRKTYDGSTTVYSAVQGAGFINSNYSTIKGGTTSAQNINLINAHRSLVNTPHTDSPYSQLVLGGSYNFIYDTPANTILIGNGLESIKGQEPRIIIGNYNDERNTNSGDRFIIADGNIVDGSFYKEFDAANANATLGSTFFSTYSASGPKIRRHNIFAVNNKGNFTVKGADGAWACFGTSGLTAHSVNGAETNTYLIDYASIYNKINVEDAVYNQIRNIDEKIKIYDNDIAVQPRTVSEIIIGDTNLNDNKLELKNNDILNVSFINKSYPSDTSLQCVVSYTMSGSNGFGTRKLTMTNGTSQSFLYVEDSTNAMTGFSKINN